MGIISDRGTAPDTLKAAGLLPKTVKVTGAAAASPTVQMGIAELAAGGEGGKPVEHTVITANPAVGQLTLVKSREATKQAFATRDVHPACTSKAIIVSGPEMYALNRAAWDYIFAHDELVFARTTPEQVRSRLRCCCLTDWFRTCPPSLSWHIDDAPATVLCMLDCVC